MQTNEKPKISYPCNWSYTVIGTNAELMRTAIDSIIAPKKYSIKESNASKTGKYQSLIVELTVATEDERVGIFEQLSSSDAIRIVM